MNFAIEVCQSVFKTIKDYAPKGFIIGYRISPEEIHGNNIGYTWHESTQLIKKLTERFDFDYIHISLLQYDAKPADANKTYCELMRAVMREETKLLVADSINTNEKMCDALNYVDIISLGRSTWIDPEIGRKISEGRLDDIDREFNERTVNHSKIPAGTISVLAQTPDFAMPGIDDLKQINSFTLNMQMTNNGTKSQKCHFLESGIFLMVFHLVPNRFGDIIHIGRTDLKFLDTRICQKA